MANPIDPTAIARTRSPEPQPNVPAAAPPRGPRFAEVLRGRAPEPAVIPERLRTMMRDISEGERAVDRVIAQASSGHDFSVPELIALQARVYRYTQELELFSKMVDKGSSGVRQVLQTQV